MRGDERVKMVIYLTFNPVLYIVETYAVVYVASDNKFNGVI